MTNNTPKSPPTLTPPLLDTPADELICDTIAPTLNPPSILPELNDIIDDETHVDYAELPMLTEAIAPIDTDELQAELQINVLRALQGRIDTLIDERFNHVMHGLLTQFVLTFAEDLKVSINEHLTDIVKRAISQELAKTLSQKNNPTLK